jgi:hypothetical protein
MGNLLLISDWMAIYSVEYLFPGKWLPDKEINSIFFCFPDIGFAVVRGDHDHAGSRKPVFKAADVGGAETVWEMIIEKYVTELVVRLKDLVRFFEAARKYGLYILLF